MIKSLNAKQTMRRARGGREGGRPRPPLAESERNRRCRLPPFLRRIIPTMANKTRHLVTGLITTAILENDPRFWRTSSSSSVHITRRTLLPMSRESRFTERPRSIGRDRTELKLFINIGEDSNALLVCVKGIRIQKRLVLRLLAFSIFFNREYARTTW